MSEPNDHEWLLARERGEDISHVPAQARATYHRIGALVRALPDQAPSPGWKHRVLAALDEPPARVTLPRRRRGWAIAGSAMAAAATVVVVVLALRPPGSGESMAEPIVTTEIRRGDQPHRGGDVNIGDTLVVHAEADRPIELRVYGDTGEPLARCNEAQGCTVARDGKHRRYTLELPLRSLGDVRTILFTADRTSAAAPTSADAPTSAPISAATSFPASFQNLNTDLENAQSAKIEARQIAVVHVQ